MIIKRDRYLNKLIAKKQNGLIKIVTGTRRSGKSYLLFKLYHDYLNSIGIKDSNIIELALDEAINARYRNPMELDSFIRKATSNKVRFYYIFIDEIQCAEKIQNPYLPDNSAKISFVDVLLGLMKLPNVDLYVTGSNSKMLSSDIITEFRDRGDEVRVYPLSYSEFYSTLSANAKKTAWSEYCTYGGMPLAVTKKTHEDKSKYLKDLFTKTYIKDVLERNNIVNDTIILEDLLNIISSSIGSLTNPTTISNTFRSVKKIHIKPTTINSYLDYFVDAFLISKAQRYDVKGRKYIGTPLKYYFVDVGLRNARLNFRQNEEGHIMENILYNELLIRGYDVDIGIVEYNIKDSSGKKIRKQLEIDFVANKGNKRYYIQSALHVDDKEKQQQETNSLNHIEDSFKKIVVIKDTVVPWHDEKGILYICVEDFLLNENAIDE